MRINRFVASASGLSRRAADQLIKEGKVRVNGQLATAGQDVSANQQVSLDGKLLKLADKETTLLMHKPVGYVVSRNGQGAPTVYELLPEKYLDLKPIGRLDKDSSGLLLLTTDGALSQSLTHPKFKKPKIYEVRLDKILAEIDRSKLVSGVVLEDGPSKLTITKLNANNLTVTIREGRKRQIRRSFEVLGYKVIALHRITFGNYNLSNLKPGEFREL